MGIIIINTCHFVFLGRHMLTQVPYTLESDSAVANALRNVMYLDEDTLHRRSLEQEPIQNIDGTEMEFPDDEQTSNEKKTKNPLLALQVCPTRSRSLPWMVITYLLLFYAPPPLTANAGGTAGGVERVRFLRRQRDVLGPRRGQDRRWNGPQARRQKRVGRRPAVKQNRKLNAEAERKKGRMDGWMDGWMDGRALTPLLWLALLHLSFFLFSCFYLFFFFPSCGGLCRPTPSPSV